MELSVKERIELLGVLPKKGSFEKLIVKKDIVNKISINQEDIKKYEIRQLENGQIVWNLVDNKDTELFEFSDLELKYIESCLIDLNKQEDLPESLFNVYKQIVNK